ncbi:MAG: ABC transporter substrate-binding protein [Anaerolineaceae bacterium]|nr:ABC transporter substrate-binding protein [Anaerolineaceae bacterium]
MTTYSYQMEAPVIEPPQRVVSLVPSVTESLFDLGLGSRVVGITDYCIYPEAGVTGLPRIGGTKNPDTSRIIALKPDLVIANMEENRKADVEALAEAGIPVWVTFPKTVSDVLNLLWNIMHVFDETSMVPRVRLIEQTVDWIKSMNQSPDDQLVSVFVPIWFDPLMTFNADTYCHDLLRICGGHNVFADRQRQYPLQADLGEAAPYPPEKTADLDTRYPRITLDEVVKAQPQVILLPGEPYAFTEAHVPVFADLDVPAAHSGRIHLVDGSLLTWHGTRIAHALNLLPQLLTG